MWGTGPSSYTPRHPHFPCSYHHSWPLSSYTWRPFPPSYRVQGCVRQSAESIEADGPQGSPWSRTLPSPLASPLSPTMLHTPHPNPNGGPTRTPFTPSEPIPRATPTSTHHHDPPTPAHASPPVGDGQPVLQVLHLRLYHCPCRPYHHFSPSPQLPLACLWDVRQYLSGGYGKGARPRMTSISVNHLLEMLVLNVGSAVVWMVEGQ